MTQINRAGQPATIYMHPYEYDPIEFRELGHPVSWRMRLHQGLGRRSFPSKVDRLLSDFRFGSIGDVLGTLGDLPCHEYRCSDGR